VKKLKVVTIVGTRPEIIRLSRLLPKLDELTEHTLVHTGQNYDPQLSDVFFRDLELRQPDIFLNVETSSLGAAMGDVLRLTEKVLVDIKPDAVMILGDTNSAVSAIIAERMHIPVYHMEAGNRSFDNNVPEELNRKMVDHIASYNLPYSEAARRNLLAEGLGGRFVFKTGSPIKEIYNHYSPKVLASVVLERLGLEPKQYFLASIHRQENVDNPEKLRSIFDALTELGAVFRKKVLVSTHPRTARRLKEFGVQVSGDVQLCEPFGYIDYNKLQLEALCVVSDSGSIAEESSIMNFPAVSVRDSTERPEGIEYGSVQLAGSSKLDILLNVERSLARGLPIAKIEDYEIDNFSERVITTLFSTVHKHRFWANLA
jgi:UDP-N-acetyl-L-fucosamine synthase